jgi:hypothetical protein
MSVFHQERTGFDHHWTRILCIYSAGVCPFHLVVSFKFGNHKSIIIVKIGLISFRPLLFFLPFSISFCFVDFVLLSLVSLYFVFISLISFRFVSRIGFDHHWTRILCIYSAGVCPFHLVASFKFGNHKSNVKSVERRGIKITEGFALFRFHFVDFVSFRFVFVDFVSFRFVSFSLILFRFVSFLFRFALLQSVPITNNVMSSNLAQAIQCYKVCQWFVADPCFPLCTPFSSTDHVHEGP